MSENCKDGNALGAMKILPCVSTQPVIMRTSPSPSRDSTTGRIVPNFQSYAQRGMDTAEMPLCEKHGWKGVESFKVHQGRASFDGSNANTRYLGAYVEATISSQGNETIDFQKYDAFQYLDSEGHVTETPTDNKQYLSDRGIFTLNYESKCQAGSGSDVGRLTGNLSANGNASATRGSASTQRAYRSSPTMTDRGAGGILGMRPDPAANMFRSTMLTVDQDMSLTDAQYAAADAAATYLAIDVCGLSASKDPTTGKMMVSFSSNIDTGLVNTVLSVEDIRAMSRVVPITYHKTNDDGTEGDLATGGTISIQWDVSVSATTISLTYKQTAAYSSEKQWYTDGYSSDWTANASIMIEVNVTLNTPYTVSEVSAQAKALLNEWNMADDVQYPWRTDGDCRTLPLVTYDESAGNAPALGWVDSRANTNDFTGQIRGKPRANAKYNDGWIDFNELIYVFTDGCSGIEYKYGGMSPSALPTATQWSVGADDDPPYGRFSCAAKDEFRDYSSKAGVFHTSENGVKYRKMCFLKEPLPAQNFFGACGAKRDWTLKDANCGETTDKRWPNAWAICGAVRFTANRDAATGIVTVTYPALTGLVDGDKVTFILGNDTETEADIQVSNVTPESFKYQGELPTGTYFKSAGATGVWFADTRPKGDFVWSVDSGHREGSGDGEHWVRNSQLQQGNVKPCPCTTNYRAVIAVLPAGSPERSDDRWLPSSTTIATIGAVSAVAEYWSVDVCQAMTDLFWTNHQDEMIQQAGVCAPNMIDGHANYTVPKVEARLTAPAGAPEQFNTYFALGNQRRMSEVQLDCGCSVAAVDGTFDAWPTGTFLI